MNRLILIGNGFDLAHGLKTRYSDFMLGLFKYELMDAENHQPRQVDNSFLDATDVRCQGTKLFTIQKDLRLNGNEFKREVASIPSFDIFHQFLMDKNIKIIFPEVTQTGKSDSIEVPYDSILKQMFEILTVGDVKWVDVEGSYYEHLKNIINRFTNHGERIFNKDSKEKVRVLHTELNYLKEKLEAYLTELMAGTPGSFNTYDRNFWANIKGEFSKSERQRLAIPESFKLPKAVHILNFNYTDTIYKYEDHNQSGENPDAKVDFNFIHGELNKTHNPIIFGYGDETDELYGVLEKLNDNRLFEHIKSFGYFRTGNYHRLLRFLESDDYQVCVIGHSCGLSDRVMLKHIFEHQHCKSIQIFYYQREDGSDDYTEKTQEISRHFDDKGSMREKIVPKPNCLPISGLSLAYKHHSKKS